jgi:hypothetical protein
MDGMLHFLLSGPCMIKDGMKTTLSIYIIELCFPFPTIITEKEGPITVWPKGTRSGATLISEHCMVEKNCTIDQAKKQPFLLLDN